MVKLKALKYLDLSDCDEITGWACAWCHELGL